jgi:PAS domain S-box-containing protein
MTFRNKIFTGYLLMALLFSGGAFLYLQTLHPIETTFELFSGENIPVLNLIQDIRISGSQLHTQILDVAYLVALKDNPGSLEGIANELSEIDQTKTKLINSMSEYRKRVAQHIPDESSYIIRLQTQVDDLVLMADEYKSSVLDNSAILSMSTKQKLEDLEERFQAITDEIVDREISEVADRRKNVIDAVFNAKLWIGLSSLFTLVLALIIAIIFVRRITKPVHKLLLAMQNYSEKKVAQPVEILNDDEIGQLAESFETMIGQIEEQRVELEKNLAQKSISLNEANAFSENTLNSISDLFYAYDLGGRFIKCNKAFLTVTGYSEQDLATSIPEEIFSAEDIPRMAKAVDRVRKTGNATEDAWLICRNGSRILCEFNYSILMDGEGNPSGFSAVGRDLTERIRNEKEKTSLEHQLHQAQKIDSIGKLAGGVAHDFNNMLGIILGHVELAIRKTDPEQATAKHLEGIRTAAKHSADLTRQLLTFARKQAIIPKVLDLNSSVEGTLKMLQRLIGENIKLCWIPAEEKAAVKVDPAQLDQILANLCINARDAITGTGHISIETKLVTIDKNYKLNHPYVVQGEYLRLSVSDDGSGIDKELQERIFEPFFTTKDIGFGTGLGLSTVYGAVKQNHGFIELYSEPGKGTTFNVYFPCHEFEEDTGRKTTSIEDDSGTETILLVEDDENLLYLEADMLKEGGYTVLTATTTEAALLLAKKHQGDIHLLITDVVMPAMNGRELSNKILTMRPEMKVLFMSGYTADIISKQGLIEEGIQFLQKPVSFKAIMTKVREVLNTAGFS